MGFGISPAPHKVTIGPSTRRIIDFSEPENSFGINPTGQSGYFYNDNFDDQAKMYIKGQYRKHLLNRDEIRKVKVSTLTVKP